MDKSRASHEFHHLLHKYSDFQDTSLLAQDLRNSAMSPINSNGSSETYSKAAALAMRKLQERIRVLEQENTRLLEKANENERRYLQERENSKRLSEDVRELNENNKRISAKFRDLEEEHGNLHRKTLSIDEQLKLKESQIRHLELDSKNTKDQLLIDNENLKLQIEHLKRQINSISGDEKNWIVRIEKIDREKSILQGDLDNLRTRNHKLDSEIKALAENLVSERREKSILEKEIQEMNNRNFRLDSDLKLLHEKLNNDKYILQKDFHLAEGNLVQKNEDLNRVIRELEMNNMRLSKDNTNYEDQIKYLQQEIEDLKYRPSSYKTSSNASSKRPKSAHKSKLSKNQNSFSASKLKTQTISPSVSSSNINRHVNLRCHDISEEIQRQRSTSRSLSPKPHDKSFQISKLEKEMQELNKDYRHLLHMSNSESSNFGGLKNEISSLTKQMERKGDELFQLKKKYQNY